MLWEWQSGIPLPPSTTGSGVTTTPGGGSGGDLLNCADITERNFAIDPNNDPNNFDGDNDGIGCETGAGGEVTEPETPGGGPTDLGPYGNVVR
jgi:hypothetical protein